MADGASSSAAHGHAPLAIFDDGKGAFGPLTDLRPAFDLRAGVGTLAERIEAAFGRKADAFLASSEHAALVAESGRPTELGRGAAIAVNGRVLEPGRVARELRPGEALLSKSGELVACWRECHGRDELLATARDGRVVDVALASAPWDLTSSVARTLDEDLALFASSRLSACARRHLRPDEGQSFGNSPILIDATATVGPMCVLDASKGPIVLGPGVVVRPMSVLVGPCAVLDGSSVAERSLLKAGTVIGPHCRAGGEIGGTIFQSYSNKSHDGHLGDSFVGEWVNIGAGSDNSNLLNTYGEVIVRLEQGGGLVRTGRQFWGSILGDHAKLAIGTRLMTGTTIGTGAMIALSTPPAQLVPRFAWCVDAPDAPRIFRIEKFLETARAMMSRRAQAPGLALETRLRALHAKAAGA
jgi:UDP-N-acetylglucosamine diphosphorylase/glucosamine-1-phosphate N-acetyltransferase